MFGRHAITILLLLAMLVGAPASVVMGMPMASASAQVESPSAEHVHDEHDCCAGEAAAQACFDCAPCAPGLTGTLGTRVLAAKQANFFVQTAFVTQNPTQDPRPPRFRLV
ncbi:hypothetical protein CAI21_11240 [Alkalilimnicola ehrlichii]|uniref:Uncharacterized protein n=1 Tax=Alkalilimnicola ehrlichii TaxID=351052 RepID=A0A3E0X2C4_9GAMM|nr:hypothetical protein [Alkalilimnicola ehrlichii]RFA29015.1 hypothetical protein CAI21_11240 [Alkalilimnicola ehrlichii]RFA38650.1 hypothetical protein CAL65_04790 [Alkalilimnicola ehrlichii]